MSFARQSFRFCAVWLRSAALIQSFRFTCFLFQSTAIATVCSLLSRTILCWRIIQAKRCHQWKNSFMPWSSVLSEVFSWKHDRQQQPVPLRRPAIAHRTRCVPHPSAAGFSGILLLLRQFILFFPIKHCVLWKRHRAKARCPFCAKGHKTRLIQSSTRLQRDKTLSYLSFRKKQI